MNCEVWNADGVLLVVTIVFVFFRPVDILNMTKIHCFWVMQMMTCAQHNSDIFRGCVIAVNNLLQVFQAGRSWEKTEPDKSAPEVTPTLATQKSPQNRHTRGSKNAGALHVTGSRQSLSQKDLLFRLPLSRFWFIASYFYRCFEITIFPKLEVKISRYQLEF